VVGLLAVAVASCGSWRKMTAIEPDAVGLIDMRYFMERIVYNSRSEKTVFISIRCELLK